jgi:NADH-quinone oxidoreductase subunit G
MTAAPTAWAQALADIASHVAAARGIAAPAPASARAEGAKAVADLLLSGERKAILLGNAAAQHPQASTLLALAQWLGEHTGATVGYLGEGANAIGAQLVGALPGPGGLSASRMLAQPMKALLLLHTEPVLDAADAAAAARALAGSGLVVSMSPFRDAAAEHADVLLPVAPSTETAGSFVNAEGRLQSFHGVVRPLGETRPGWKVLRVLGNLLGLDGFGHESAEQVRAEALGDPLSLAARLDNAAVVPPSVPPVDVPPLQRVADVPIYATDPIVRRAPSLQATADARPPVVGLPTATWQRLGLGADAQVLVGQGEAAVVLPARHDPTLAEGTVRIAVGHPSTAGLGPMFGAIAVEPFAARS